MKRLDAVRARHERQVDETTDIDQKLEDGVINEWLDYGDSDIEFLLKSLDEMLRVSWAFIEEVDEHVDAAAIKPEAETYFTKLKELRLAIHRIRTEEEEPPTHRKKP
jgi:type II restriction/modification system DNA methylase subunit YeeA